MCAEAKGLVKERAEMEWGKGREGRGCKKWHCRRFGGMQFCSQLTENVQTAKVGVGLGEKVLHVLLMWGKGNFYCIVDPGEKKKI